MAQTWYVIRGDTETQISGGTVSYRVSARNIGAPPKRNIAVRGPFQQGETFYSFRYEKRIISLVFHAVTSSLALADARRDDIYNLWKGIEGETVTLKVVRDDGAVRLIDGEVINTIDFPEAINERFGATQSFAVQLECHNPFWRKETTAVTSLTVNDTTIIPYAGQFPAEPIINIIGPITNPVVTQVYTGKKLDFTGTTIAANNNYQIDTRYGYKTVFDGSAVNQIAKLTNDSDLADFNINDFPRVGGIVWQTHLAAEQNSWQSVAYGNGVWVAIAGDGTNQVMRSTNNGVTWTAVASAEQNPWQSVAYGNGVWVAVADMEFSAGTQAIMRSTNNGVTWASISAPSNNSNWKSVAYANNTWVAVSGRYPIPIVNQVMRSTNDGVTWTSVAAAEQNPWQSVAYGNGVWVAVAYTGGIIGANQVMRSTNDGATWTAVASAEQNNWQSVAYGNGVWIAVAPDGTNRVMRSTNDGVTWTAVTAVEQNNWQSVAYGNGVWVAVAYTGTNRVMRSINDGVTWTAVAAAEQNRWNSIAFGNNMWVAVASTGTNRVMRSEDVSQNYTVTGTGTTSATSVTMTYNELYLGL